MSEEGSSVESVKEKLMDSFNRKNVAVLVSLIVVAGVAITAIGSLEDKVQDTSKDDVTGPEETTNNTSNQKDVSRVGLSASQIKGDITKVTVDDERAEPSSPTIAPEDGIKFVNQAGMALKFEFDREIDTFQIPAGESIIVNPESIVYYTVNPVDDSVEFREISARINVQ